MLRKWDWKKAISWFFMRRPLCICLSPCESVTDYFSFFPQKVAFRFFSVPAYTIVTRRGLASQSTSRSTQTTTTPSSQHPTASTIIPDGQAQATVVFLPLTTGVTSWRTRGDYLQAII